MLTREQILAVDDLPRKRVAVPEWGGDVHVKTLTAAQREEWENSPKGLVRATLVALAACDEQGNPLFKQTDAAALAAKAAPAVIRVFDVAVKLNQVTKEDVDALEKNSETSPSDSSPSASPAS